MSTEDQIREIFADLSRSRNQGKAKEENAPWTGVPALPRNLRRRNSKLSGTVVNPHSGIRMPNWAQTFLGVDRAACCWIGCFPFQLEHGSKRELKLWTMLAEIKVKWYSADPLAHAKEPFLHGSMPTCVHLPKLAELEPFGDFPDRGLCKKCADRLNDRIRQDLHRVIKAEKILLSWEEDWDEETITTWKELYSSEPAIAEAHQEKQKAFIELMLGKTPFLIPPR